MKENEVSVLDQYDIDIKSTRRIRGAILCACLLYTSPSPRDTR